MKKDEQFDLLLLNLPIQYFSPNKKKLSVDISDNDDTVKIKQTKKSWYNSEWSQCYRSARPISKIMFNNEKNEF